MQLNEWLGKNKWTEMPFEPVNTHLSDDMIVGHGDIKDRLEAISNEKGKAVLFVGSWGAGKTTMLKWLKSRIDSKGNGKKVIFVPNPPTKTELVGFLRDEFAPKGLVNKMFNALTGPSFPTTIQGVPGFLNQYVNGKSIIYIVDEIEHTQYNPAIKEGLDHFSTLLDETKGILILSGTSEGLLNIPGSLRSRISEEDRIEIESMDLDNTKSMIQKRIESVGGKSIVPFTDDAIESVWKARNGVPRAVIDLCMVLVKEAAKQDREMITLDFVNEIVKQSTTKQAKAQKEAKKENVPQKEIEETITKSARENTYLSKLPTSEYEILAALRFAPNLTADEIAKKLKKPTGSTKVSLTRLLGRDEKRKKEGVPYPLLEYDEKKTGKSVSYVYRLAKHVERELPKE